MLGTQKLATHSLNRIFSRSLALTSPFQISASASSNALHTSTTATAVVKRIFSSSSLSKAPSIKDFRINMASSAFTQADFDAKLPVKTLTADDTAAVDNFKAFLRIPTVTSDGPSGPSAAAVAFLSAQCEAIGLTYQTHEFTKGYPVFVATWQGTEPELPSILLNSHYDVVPADASRWSLPPFDATELDNGDIVARGAQDMKCVCVQHLEAARRLKARGFVPRRTLHFALQPDEEMGGTLGMAKWVVSDELKALNIGFALDEGIASESATATAFYGERAVWWLRLLATGSTGHASRFIENTAVERLLATVTKFLQYRSEQEAVFKGHAGCKHGSAVKLGDVVTLNLTMLRAGMTTDNGASFALNVVPPEAHAGFDIRVPPHINLDEFEEMIRGWLEPGVEFQFVVKSKVNNATATDPTKNPYWGVFQQACERAGMPLEPQIFPAATDGRYLRNVAGLPVIGFSPIVNQPILLHENDERLNKYTFVRGIEVFEHIIQDLTSMDANSGCASKCSE